MKPKQNKINGKDAAAEHKRLKKAKATMEKLWGLNEARYETLDVNEYEAQLDKMEKFDLFQECQKVGLVPNHNRSRMVGNLLKEFERYNALVKTSGQVAAPPPQLKKRTLDILKRWANA